jgi:hypothetical protein
MQTNQTVVPSDVPAPGYQPPSPHVVLTRIFHEFALFIHHLEDEEFASILPALMSLSETFESQQLFYFLVNVTEKQREKLMEQEPSKFQEE